MAMGKGMRMYLMANGGSQNANRNEMRGGQGGNRNQMGMEYGEMRGGRGGGNRNEMGMEYNEMRGGRGGGNRNEMGMEYGEMRGGRGGGNRNEMGMEYGEMRGGSGGGNRNKMGMEYGEMRGGQGGNRNEGGNMRFESNDRRQGDPRGGYDTMESDQNEARYRGRDGRYHAGRRRSEYEDEMRMGKDGEKYEVTIEKPEDAYMPGIWPYMPRGEEEERRSNYGDDGQSQNRKIGFGANMMGDYHRSEGEMEKGMAKMHGGKMQGFDQQTAEEWVRNMQNEDRAHPKGGRWGVEQVKPLAMKHGMPTEGKRWWEFYAMVNAMYSDYSEVAKKYNITSPDFYALMAKAFMDDQDAEEDKVALYYEYIAKK